MYANDQYALALPWGIFYFATLIGFYSVLLLLAVGVAAGLVYLADLAEEYSALAKRIMKWAIYCVAVLFFLLIVVDGISWWRCLLSMGSCIVYFRLLDDFPWVYLNSPKLYASFAAFVIENISWYTFFAGVPVPYPFWSTASFFAVFVWVVPIGFFTTLAAVDSSLPSGALPTGVDGPKRRNIASYFAYLLPKGMASEKRN